MLASGLSNTVELECIENAEHLTVMPVVSAGGKDCPLIVVLPGLMNRFRKRANGTIETKHD